MQKELVHLLAPGFQVFAEGPHDHPDAIIDAVLSVVAEVRHFSLRQGIK
jgi:hypothetical protein